MLLYLTMKVVAYTRVFNEHILFNDWNNKNTGIDNKPFKVIHS